MNDIPIEIYNHIKLHLRLNNFRIDEASIDYVYNYTEGEKPQHESEVEVNFYRILEDKEPSNVFYYLAYNQDGLHNEVIVYLVVERLRKKQLYATRRQIDELCYQALCLFEEGEAVDLTHASNMVIKSFSKGNWRVPNGFLERFNHYAEDIRG